MAPNRRTGYRLEDTGILVEKVRPLATSSHITAVPNIPAKHLTHPLLYSGRPGELQDVMSQKNNSFGFRNML